MPKIMKAIKEKEKEHQAQHQCRKGIIAPEIMEHSIANGIFAYHA